MESGRGRPKPTCNMPGEEPIEGGPPLAIALETVLGGFGIRTLDELATCILSEDRDALVGWINSKGGCTRLAKVFMAAIKRRQQQQRRGTEAPSLQESLSDTPFVW